MIKLIVELIELASLYVRQQVKMTMDKSVADPLRKAGLAVAAAILSAVIFGLAAIFITVGLFLLFVRIVGAAWIAFLITGIVLLIAGAIASRRGRGNND